jgi:hypothetical protein
MGKFYLLVVLLSTPTGADTYNLPFQGLPLAFHSMDECVTAKKRLMPDESRALCFEMTSTNWQ